MGKNKARHILHGVLDCLPIILIPIFMIYSQNHEINDNTLQVQENKIVDFNQIIENGNFEDNTKWSGTYGSLSINDNTCTFTCTNAQTNSWAQNLVQDQKTLYANHKYLFKANLYQNTNNINVQLRLNDPFELYSFGGLQDFAVIINNSTTRSTRILIGYWGETPVNASFIISNIQMFDLTQMFGSGNEPTIAQFNNYFSSTYYDYTLSENKVIENYETITYDDTDIMSQSFYCLYNAVDKYFNMGNVFGMHNLYNWFEVNIFGGSASPSIYIVWNIVLYEFIMDLLFLLYGLFMFFIDFCKRLMEKPLNSIK